MKNYLDVLKQHDYSRVLKRLICSRFCIPFNRPELADYLSVERSAMSAELSKLRDDGVLKFHKNQFDLL